MPHEINHLHLLLFSHISHYSCNVYGSSTSKWQWKASCIFFTTFSLILFSSAASPSPATPDSTKYPNCNLGKTQNHNSATVTHHNLWPNHHFPPPKPIYCYLLSMWFSAWEKERERGGCIKGKILKYSRSIEKLCSILSYSCGPYHEFNEWISLWM